MIYKFDKVAQARFYAHYEQHENIILNSETIMRAHLAKYRSLVPALALIYHLCEAGDDTQSKEVGIVALEKAIRLADFLHSHAKFIFISLKTVLSNGPAMRIGRKIASGEITEGMTINLILRRAWSGLTERDVVLSALEHLEELNWVKLFKSNRRSIIIRLNPSLREV